MSFPDNFSPAISSWAMTCMDNCSALSWILPREKQACVRFSLKTPKSFRPSLSNHKIAGTLTAQHHVYMSPCCQATALSWTVGSVNFPRCNMFQALGFCNEPGKSKRKRKLLCFSFFWVPWEEGIRDWSSWLHPWSSTTFSIHYPIEGFLVYCALTVPKQL